MSWRSAVAFYTQLGTLLRSGLVAAEAVAIAAPRSGAPYAGWADRLKEACAGGGALGEALAACGERPVASALVDAGERSGRLGELCDAIAGLYEHARQVRAQVAGRLCYPAVLLHLALAVPGVPVAVLGGSWWAVLLGPAALWAGLLAAAGLGWLAARLGLLEAAATRAPLRGLVRPLAAANACLVLHAAAAAGMLWPDALRLAAAGCGSRAWGRRLAAAGDDLGRGRLPTCAAALAAAGLPREVVAACETAERAGRLEETLARCAEQQRETFRARVDWTARLATGGVYALALLIAAGVVVFMFLRFYIAPIRELSQGL